MNQSTSNVPNTNINVPVWWSNGCGTSFRRDSLPSYHPESTYNYIKNVLMQEPERFGIFDDSHNECSECGKSCRCWED